MILSYKEIDEIGTGLMKELSRSESMNFDILPIEVVASDHLNLDIKYTNLSSDGSIYGLTAYADTEYNVKTDKGIKIIELKSNQVLLDEIFIDPKQKNKLLGKRRFTLAHECAHQILFGLESVINKKKFEKLYATRKTHSVRELKTAEDWNEWQANVLGSVMLMPRDKVDYFMYLIVNSKKIINYDGWFNNIDLSVVKKFCEMFGVSKIAAIIRLRQLGYIEDKNRYEYIDPLEIIYDEK